MIKVAKPFMLQMPPPQPDAAPKLKERPHGGGPVPEGAPVYQGLNELLYFPAPGEYEVDQEVADHWYTQMHLEGYVPPPPSVPSEVRVMLTAEQAKDKAEADKATAANAKKVEADTKKAEAEAARHAAHPA
jgi:hypothetical protein